MDGITIKSAQFESAFGVGRTNPASEWLAAVGFGRRKFGERSRLVGKRGAVVLERI
jgi:hypothetical protein